MALLSLVAVLVPAAPAQAQAVCDPYSGCNTTTSTGPRPRPVIIIDISVTVAGQVIRARACGYLPGITVKITINGIVVAQVVTTTVPPKNCNPNSFALARRSSGVPLLALAGPLAGAFSSSNHISAQAVPTNAYAEASVTVPNLPPGTYLVCAEAPGFDTPCTPLRVVSSTTPGGGGGGPLAFTGFHIAELAAVGLVALILGRVLVRRGKRRVRRA